MEGDARREHVGGTVGDQWCVDGSFDATSLLLKRGSIISLRKEPSPANPKAHRT